MFASVLIANRGEIACRIARTAKVSLDALIAANPKVHPDRIEIGQGSRGPITEKIQTAFFDIVNGRNPKYAEWLTPVR